jgi:hypothetical protein
MSETNENKIINGQRREVAELITQLTNAGNLAGLDAGCLSTVFSGISSLTADFKTQ